MAALAKAICLAFVLMAAAAPPAEAAISCSQVNGNLAPCLLYLVHRAPLAGCCRGVKTLYHAARTTPDRQTVCKCLKALAASYSGAILNRAAEIPKQCGVNIRYKISPSTVCSQVR